MAFIGFTGIIGFIGFRVSALTLGQALGGCM